MRFKTLLLIIAIVIISSSLSVVTDAEQVPWSSIEYSASAKAETFVPKGVISSDYEENLGPPLPVTASALVQYAPHESSGSSEVDSSFIDIDTLAFSCG
jgi:hypothetical protein